MGNGPTTIATVILTKGQPLLAGMLYDIISHFFKFTNKSGIIETHFFKFYP